MVLLLDKHGDYRPCLSLLAVRETERLLRVTIAGFLLALPILAGGNEVDSAHRRGPCVGAGAAVPGRRKVAHAVGAPGAAQTESLRRARRSSSEPVRWDAGSTPHWCARRNSDSIRWHSSGREARPAASASFTKSRTSRSILPNVLPGPLTPRLLRRLGATALIIAAPELSADET